MYIFGLKLSLQIEIEFVKVSFKSCLAQIEFLDTNLFSIIFWCVTKHDLIDDIFHIS